MCLRRTTREKTMKTLIAVWVLITAAVSGLADTVMVVSPNGSESFVVRQIMVCSFVTDAPVGSTYDVAIVGHWTSPTNVVDRQIGIGTVGSGLQKFSADIPADLPAGDDYRIRVVVEGNMFFAQDQSDANFSISTNTNSVTVTRPNVSQRWAVGSKQLIMWDNSGIARDYEVQIGIIDERYNTESGDRSEQIIAYSIPNTGGFEWTVPASVGSMDLTVTDQPVYRIVVSSWADTVTGYAIGDVSDEPFSIITNQPSIGLQKDYNDHWISGTVHAVSYMASGLAPDGDLSVFLTPVGQEGGSVKILSSSIQSEGSNIDKFTLPIDVPSGDYNILLEASSPAFGGMSFVARGTGIITVTSTITSPAAGVTLRAGKTYSATWVGREYKIPSYEVYLINVYDKAFGQVFLGSVSARSGSFEYSIPHKVPTGKGYRLWFVKPGSRGFTSDDFNIVHDNRKANR